MTNPSITSVAGSRKQPARAKSLIAAAIVITFGLTLQACATKGPIGDDVTGEARPTEGAPATPAPTKTAKQDRSKPKIKEAKTASPVADGNESQTDAFIVRTSPDADKPREANKPTATAEYTNLWDRVRAGLKLPKMEGPIVEAHERWFVNNPEYMERMLQRANLYLFHIVEEVEKRNMPMEIALLPAIESAYQPRAYSHARASGLWQFIPSTGRLYGLKSDWWYDGRRDILESTRAALDYLEKLGKDFDGDWYLALASYNCGEGKVGRIREDNRRKGLSVDYQDLPLPPETQHYVPKLMAMVNIVSDPARYGLELRDIPNSPYFVQVDAGAQIDLGVVAKLTKLEIDDLYAMNPGFNRWATSPNGPHNLLIPVSTKAALMDGLSELTPEQRMQWARHQVRRGDSVARIAHSYGVSPEAIRIANKLNGNRLKLGQDLLIPVSGRKLLVAGNASNVSAKEPALRTTSTDSSENAADSKVRVIHRVRAGETLYSIAKRYNVYVRQITDWNFMERDAVLRMGQKLLIWTKPERSTSADHDQSQKTG